MTSHGKRALITGGAGLIGSHVADLLRREGWRVRILDNLEPQTHRRGKPAWIGGDVEFIEGDVADRATIANALNDIDVVFHQAAYGGYIPGGAKTSPGNHLLPTPKRQRVSHEKMAIAIFCTRLLNDLPPVFYEDGEQSRDMAFVEDIARANLLAAESDHLDGLPVNVGSGAGVSIRKIAEQISDALNIHIAPEVNGEFRPGEMRHLTSDTTRIRAAGDTPPIELATGIRRYLDWIRQQSDVRDYFSEAANILRSKGIVHRVKVGGERRG